MAGSFSNSWTLMKASFNVLKMDKELLVFPLMSGIATLLVTATFIAPVVALGGLEGLDSESGSYLASVFGFLFYLVQYTVIFFFNSALVGAALIRLDGGDPTVSDGLAIASKRMPAIIGYAAISATVGMILQAISERAGILGQIVSGLGGMAWRLASYLAIPVLVTEDVGPIDAVKTSGALFKNTWGEQVVGNFVMGWAMALMWLSWSIVWIGVTVLVANVIGVAAVVLPVVAIGIFGYVLLALFSSALKGIYTAALYRYATTGEAGFFDDSIMGNAFRPK
jgi:hypothetical protein